MDKYDIPGVLGKLLLAGGGLYLALIFAATVAGMLIFGLLILAQPITWIVLILVWLIIRLVFKLNGSKKTSDTKNEAVETVCLDETALNQPAPPAPPAPLPEANPDFKETAWNPDDKYKPPHQLLQRPAPPNPINTIPVYDPKSFVPFDEDLKSVAATEPDSAEKTGDSPATSRVDLVDGLSEERAEPKQKPAVGEDVQPSAPAVEGQRKLRSRYEPVRDPKLREAAIRIHGRDCCVCGFNFDDFFGERLGSGYVEMHHLKTIAAGERLTDPATDLAPLCANCHAMADRLARIMKPPPDTIDSLKLVLLAHLKERLTPNGHDDI